MQNHVANLSSIVILDFWQNSMQAAKNALVIIQGTKSFYYEQEDWESISDDSILAKKSKNNTY